MNVLKGLGVIDGKHTEEALSCPHVLIPHGAVLLLTCSVQDVQETRLSVNHHLLPVGVLQTNQHQTQACLHQKDHFLFIYLSEYSDYDEDDTF